MTEMGGAARRATALVEGLVSRGWKVRVITRAGSLKGFRLSRDENLAVLEVPGFNNRWAGAALFYVCALPLGLIWSLRASVLVAMQLMSQATVASFCSFIVRRPFVAMATTGGSVSEVGYLLSRRFSVVRVALLRRAQRLIAQTEAAARDLGRIVGNDHVEILPNPVRAATRAELSGQPTVLFSGRFSEEKDLLRLVDAWRQVVAAIPDARLCLAGAGGNFRSVEKELRRRVASDPSLQETINFTGWVPDLDLYLRDADVYVFPSLSEGMSNALLEACAYRRVVVASDIAPNKIILGDDYPLLFPAGDTDALALAIKRALEDEDVRGRAVSQIDQMLPNFSVAAILDRFEEILTDAENRARN